MYVAGPSQTGPGQYPNYPQGQGQQYGGYRPPQPGPPQGQQQRPYGYDQVSITTAPNSHRDLLMNSSQFSVTVIIATVSCVFCVKVLEHKHLKVA